MLMTGFQSSLAYCEVYIMAALVALRIIPRARLFETTVEDSRIQPSPATKLKLMQSESSKCQSSNDIDLLFTVFWYFVWTA
jgi:hypothetical protein